MQIDKSGRNGAPAGRMQEVKDRTGRKSGNFVQGDSFEDRLHKSMDFKVQVNRCEPLHAAQQVPVRRIPYSACDQTKINILEGYTLKARLEKADGQTDTCRVYVEMKEENGRMKACLFDAGCLQKNSRNVMEQIAYQTVESFQNGRADGAKKESEGGIL